MKPLILLLIAGAYFIGNLLYYLPWLLATKRNHSSRTAIGLVNWLLGWTVLGWFWALLLARSRSKTTNVQVVGAVGTDTVDTRSAVIHRIVVLATLSVVETFLLSAALDLGETTRPLVQASSPSVTVTPVSLIGTQQSTVYPEQVNPGARTDNGYYHTSFNCASATVDAERLICGDPGLAAQDVALARLFADTRDKVPDFTVLRMHARESLKFRDTYCHDVQCVRDWYSTQNHWYADILASTK